MQKIEMVDLKGQYRRIKPEIDAAIAHVLDTTAFIGGPDVKAFGTELAEYLGAKHVIPCANGTDALQIAMMALDLQPGDEVITTAFTYAATCEVIALLKLTPYLWTRTPTPSGLTWPRWKKPSRPKPKPLFRYTCMANVPTWSLC